MKKPFVTLEQLNELVKQYPTPFHLYDEKGIRENARRLHKAFAWNPGYREHFAVKATPNPQILKILREDIELGGGDFDRIIKGLHPALSLDQDQKLKRMPLGFDPDTAYADYIKLKNFCLSGSFDDSRLDLDEIAEIFRSAKPFLDYINRAIEFAKEEM